MDNLTDDESVSDGENNSDEEDDDIPHANQRNEGETCGRSY